MIAILDCESNKERFMTATRKILSLSCFALWGIYSFNFLYIIYVIHRYIYSGYILPYIYNVYIYTRARGEHFASAVPKFSCCSMTTKKMARKKQEELFHPPLDIDCGGKETERSESQTNAFF